MTFDVSFADLTHTGQVVAANTFPLGVTMVAAYAEKVLGDRIAFEVFRYPEDFSRYLDATTPKIACFSIFAWNMRLSHEYAGRIKAASPSTITVFGGVNVPSAPDDQLEFLARWPAIDFCIEGEGELAFVELFEALEAAGFDGERLKRTGAAIANTMYLADGKLIKGAMLPRIADLDIIPSTFENGLSDKFFDDHLIPMLQITRGCPYACTFCHEGPLYYNKTHRFPLDRVRRELAYIADRVKVPDFIITDLNFGMFEEDLDVARELAKLQDEREWPKFVTIATAKNHKKRVIEASHLLRGALNPGAPVQSTDPEVLKNIKRKNLPLDTAIKAIAATASTDDASSFSEIILGLPGDSKAAHFRSNFEIVDTGISLLRNYQFLMLAGTEAASAESRQKHGLETRFRIKPMNLGKYSFQGDEYSVAEIEEICVAGKSMSYEDYFECRALDLTVEVFNNNGIFRELIEFLVRNGLARSDFLRAVHAQGTEGDSVLSGLYAQFRSQEQQNLWEREDELDTYLHEPGVIERYLDGEIGANEIYKFRALAVFDHMEALHRVAFGAARKLLAEAGCDPVVEEYLSDLAAFSLARKRDFLDTEQNESQNFQFDFVRLAESNFTNDPFEFRLPDSVKLEIHHSDRQRRLIDGYRRQFGTSPAGLGRILNRAHINTMYRRARYVGQGVATPDTSALA